MVIYDGGGWGIYEDFYRNFMDIYGHMLCFLKKYMAQDSKFDEPWGFTGVQSWYNRYNTVCLN